MLPPAQPHELESHLPENTLANEQVRVLYNNVLLSLAGTTALAFFLSASLWNIVSSDDLILWNGIMLCAMALRLTCWFCWRHDYFNIETKLWLSIFRSSVWVSGAAWGCSAFFMFPTYNPAYQTLLAFTLSGISSGSLTTLAIDRNSAMGFVSLAVLPLTVRLFMENGPIALPMGIMSTLYIVFVFSASARARNNLEDQFDKNTRLVAWGKERIKQQKISNVISHAQAKFITDTNTTDTISQLLMETLALTESQFGFIGEIFYDDESKPEMKLHAINNINGGSLFDSFLPNKTHPGLTLKNMNNLFGAAILKHKVIITNTPKKDMRSGDMPDGFPTISSFVAIPIFHGKTPAAILCLANKENGYDENIIEFLKPITNVINQFIEAMRHTRQQKIYAEKLHDNAKHTQAILDDVFDAIITTDGNGILKSFNHAAETMFGFLAKEILNTHIKHIIPEPKKSGNNNSAFIGNQSINQDLTHNYATGAGQELLGLRRNGKKFPIELIISKLIIDDKLTYIGVARDISDRKRNEDLKNQFISTVSHELRTPLTSIAGALGILNSGTLGEHSPQQKKLISIALNNSTRLHTLINDLLDMDKLLANKMELRIVPICILELVSKAIESHQLLADKYSITLKLMSTPKSTLIYGDAQRIQQVLANLISNAAKFSPVNSSVDIDISIIGIFARVSITDHGDGIPEEFKEKIFQRFEQADNSATRKKNGSGLGLAISKELMTRMSGNIGFTSIQGSGSRFYIDLPLVNQPNNI